MAFTAEVRSECLDSDSVILITWLSALSEEPPLLLSVQPACSLWMHIADCARFTSVIVQSAVADRGW